MLCAPHLYAPPTPTTHPPLACILNAARGGLPPPPPPPPLSLRLHSKQTVAMVAAGRAWVCARCYENKSKPGYEAP